MSPFVMCFFLMNGTVDVSMYGPDPYTGRVELVTNMNERLPLAGKSVASSKYYFAPWSMFFTTAHIEVNGVWITSEFQCVKRATP